jgi:hypothetical protein
MKTFRLFTMLTVIFMMIATTAMAQAPEKITFHALFDFTVANKTLPAGNYTIRPLSPSRLLIRSEDGHEAVIAATYAVQAKKTPTETQLIFARYGDQYFLYQMFVPGIDTGRELPRSHVEVQIAKTVTPVLVSVTGR